MSCATAWNIGRSIRVDETYGLESVPLEGADSKAFAWGFVRASRGFREVSSQKRRAGPTPDPCCDGS
jgi:hypothetical protein